MFDANSLNGKLCMAFAFAEGCIHKDGSYNTFTLPYKLNNPGDLKITASRYTHWKDNSGKLRFSDIGTGWNALAHQVNLMLTNTSSVYKNTMSLLQIAEHYAKEHNTPDEELNAVHWAANAASFLSQHFKDVTSNTTLEQLIKQGDMTNGSVSTTRDVNGVSKSGNQQTGGQQSKVGSTS